METILSLDLGTSYLKAALFDRHGAPCALARTPTPIAGTGGRREMTAERFREAVKGIFADLNRAEPGCLGTVRAVTFASQTNSFLLLDGRGDPLTPIIIWSDDRAREFSGLMEKAACISGFRETTGIPALEWEYMLAKLAWLKRNQYDAWQSAARICLVSDYLTLWLTGRHVTEGSVAGLTGAVDIRRLSWWHPVCDLLELPRLWLPAVARAGTDLGPVRGEAASELGLPPECRFMTGCLDQYAGAIGVGCLAPGIGSETTGTVLATVRCVTGFDAHPAAGVFQGPSFDPGLYFQMSFGDTSANLLQWYRDSLPGRPEFATLSMAAASVPPGADGLRLRSDVARGDIQRSFIGWDSRHTPAHGVRCIMETVALALRRQAGHLWGAQAPTVMRAAGGAARSEVWLQIKADILNIPFESTECSEPTSMGAAILAGQAVGWGTVHELAGRWVRVARSHQPQADVHVAYDALLGGAGR